MASQNQLVWSLQGAASAAGTVSPPAPVMSQNLRPAPLEAGCGGCCTLAGTGSRQRLLCCIIFFRFKGSKFAVGESGQQSEVTGLNSGCKEDGKVEVGWGGSGFHMKVVSDLDLEWGIPPTHRCVQRWQMTTAEMCGAQLKSRMEGFSFLSLFFFSFPRAGTVSLGSTDASAFPRFHTAPLPKPAVRWCPYLFIPETAPVPGEEVWPQLPSGSSGMATGSV